MAECKKYREMISGYVDGELSGNDKNELQKHLEKCASCRSLLSLYTSISEAAAESLAEPPDSFTESVMQRIKSFSEDANVNKNTESRHRKLRRPVIITFVAAAACLALAFMVSPGLFGLTGSKNSTAIMPLASTAYDAEMPESAAEDNVPNDELRSGSDAGSSGAASYAPPATADSTAVTVQSSAGMPAATEMPPQEVGGGPEYQATEKGVQEELKVYYAVFNIEGQLPDVLKAKVMTDNRDGTFNIEITPETAEQLIKDGLTAAMGAPESLIALVKYTPQT